MARSEHCQDGLQHYNPQLAYRGYTLFGAEGKAVLMDMNGNFVHVWEHPRSISNPTLLPNGNIMAQCRASASLEGQRGLNGLASAVVEIDWEGNEVWCYDDDWMHHDYERTPQGTTLIIRWAPMPKRVVRRVKGGYHDPDDDPKEMLGDMVIEVDAEGTVIREWRSWDHFDPGTEIICPLDHRKEWSHCNSVSLSPKGDWLLSFRRIDMIAEVSARTGKIRWKAHGIANHQHDVKYSSPDTITIFDNGAHKRGGVEYSRVLEIDAKTREITWEYAQNPPFSFYTFMGGSVDRLPNGNMLICETAKGQFFEVTREKQVVWDYINPFYSSNPRLGGRVNMSFRVHRYGLDHPGLKDRDLDPDRYANLNRMYGET